MKLYDTGVYLQNGHDIIPAGQADFPVSKEEAAKEYHCLFHSEST